MNSTIRNAVLGALPGIGLAGYGIYQLGKSLKESEAETVKDLVDAKATVKKHDPNLFVATSMNDARSLTDMGMDETVVNNVLKAVLGGRNAAFVASGGAKALMSPKMVNRSLIGHEIGHNIDLTKDPRRSPVLKTEFEERAWKESPFQDPEAKRVAKIMSGTYKGGDKIIIGGTVAGVGAVTLAKILKALKK